MRPAPVSLESLHYVNARDSVQEINGSGSKVSRAKCDQSSEQLTEQQRPKHDRSSGLPLSREKGWQNAPWPSIAEYRWGTFESTDTFGASSGRKAYERSRIELDSQKQMRGHEKPNHAHMHARKVHIMYAPNVL